MLIVAALGGNALLRRGEPADAATQRANVEVATAALAELAAEHQLVVTHGNGPQVGLLALQAEAYPDVTPYPLDVLGAESEGMVGYLLEEALANRLRDRQAVTLLTRVEVEADDPAFAAPSKPIGPVYDEATADRLARDRGWTVARDGRGWRRTVASPAPQRIVEINAIRTLVASGALVVCAGGGGIPVVADDGGARHGVEAVVDKDRSAALLARLLGADALLLLTDVAAIERGWGTTSATPLRTLGCDRIDELGLAVGSMGPKAEAAAAFVRATGGIAAVGALDAAADVLRGTAGTTIVPSTGAPRGASASPSEAVR